MNKSRNVHRSVKEKARRGERDRRRVIISANQLEFVRKSPGRYRLLERNRDYSGRGRGRVALFVRYGKQIKTATDFIDKVGTKSSTSDDPYVIRFKDGHEVPCADYLPKILAKQGKEASENTKEERKD